MSHRRIILLFIVSLAIVAGSYLFANSGVTDSLASSRVSLGLDDSIPDPGVQTTDDLIVFWQAGSKGTHGTISASLIWANLTFARPGRLVTLALTNALKPLCKKPWCLTLTTKRPSPTLVQYSSRSMTFRAPKTRPIESTPWTQERSRPCHAGRCPA